MSLTVKAKADFTPAPQGTHVAICVQAIDLGTQFSKFYQKAAKKVLLGWELSNEPGTDGKPLLVWKRYTASLSKNSTLRAHLEAWRGRKFTQAELEGFELKNVLGAPCMVTIAHEDRDGQTYGQVTAVTALPKGTTKPTVIANLVTFDLDKWDDGVFQTFSDNLKKTIMESAEMQERSATPVGAGASTNGAGHLDDSDIPFTPAFPICCL